eukprot:gene6301-4534_t
MLLFAGEKIEYRISASYFFLNVSPPLELAIFNDLFIYLLL